MSTKAKKVKLAKPATEKEDGVEFHHPIKFPFKGQSKPYGCGRSKTPLRISTFGKQVGAIKSERDENLLKNINAVYGNKEFIRGDYDAGTLSRLGERGLVEFVDGEKTSAKAKLRLTKLGVSQVA
jgi:hypothetical protein